jgi:hypothetical protein
VLVLEKLGWGSGVLEYCALSELHLRTRVGDAEGASERARLDLGPRPRG